MAVHFSTMVYGEIEGNPPFQNADGNSAFSRVKAWPTPTIVSFPTEGTTFFPLTNGFTVGNAYVYSVIEVPPTGLNVHSTKYVTKDSVTTLATLAG